MRSIHLIPIMVALCILEAPGQVDSIWRQRMPGMGPAGRCDHAMAFDSARGRAVLFGGQGAAGLLDDTWEWDGTGWLAPRPTIQPPARGRHAMAFDPVRGRTVLFGGTDGVGFLADTWEWDGVDWKQILPVASPLGRQAHTLVFHAGLGKSVLFGGEGKSGPLADTWEWDGTGWMRSFAIFSPPARHAHAAAYDLRRMKIDLFGGTDGPKLLADTWEWDTTYWNWLVPQTSPPARQGHAMAYDFIQGKSVLFGGSGASGPLAETWLWDGLEWSQVRLTTQPPARGRHALAYDSLRGRTLLFGGLSSGFLADTWEFGSALEGSFSGIGVGCKGSHGKSPVLSHKGRPEIGLGFSIELGDAPPARGSLLYLDVLNPAIPLDPYGAPGCTTFVRPGFLTAWVTHVTTGGVWDPAPAFKIPPDMTFLGGVFYAQAFIHDPQANALGVITSNGLKATIGFARVSPIELIERFQTTRMLDEDASGASWGKGRLLPGVLGGSGLLGPFDQNMFVGLTPMAGTLNISTDSIRVKAAHTLTGQEVLVSGGLFQFEELHVPAGLTLNFRGANPPRILVRGSVWVEGTIQVNGLPAPAHNGSQLAQGLGGRSNCGGGAGGLGALRQGNGADGSPLAFPAGSARYDSPAARAAAGKGSPMFPTSVLAITYHGYDGWVCAQLAAGGSGGSNASGGRKGSGELIGTYNPAWVATDVPPDNFPGVPFAYIPKLAAEPSVVQFLAGGSGGGGGGSAPISSMKSYTVEWHSGQGGGGGGGALLIRAGNGITIAQGGILAAAGGDSPDPQPYKRAVPGGGGSGGNILLQLGGTFLCRGAVSAPGGIGGKYEEKASYNWGSRSMGGQGGGGFLRVEAPAPPALGALAGFDPAATGDNVGLLEEADEVTGARSRFYRTLLPLPVYKHFLVEALENGQPVAYSDDPKLGKHPVFEPGKRTPVAFFLQGAEVDALGEPLPGTLTRWVESAGALNDPANWATPAARPTAVRWIVVFDRSVLSAPGTVEVTKITIVSE